mgnify:FL=1
MNDLKLNPDGDLEFVGGDLELLNDESEVSRQALQIELKTFRGEWFLDVSLGIPYLKSILKKGVSKSFVDNIFIDKVRNGYGIESLISFESEITSNRRYVIRQLKAKSITGEIISVSNVII